MTDPFPPTRSGDATIEVRYDPTEMRMSIWVLSPTVVRLRDEREVVSLPLPWSCERVRFPAAGQVELELRRYPDGKLVTPVTIDVEAETFRFPGTADPPRPVGALEAALHARRKQQRAT